MEYTATNIEEFISIIRNVNKDKSSSNFYDDIADIQTVYRGIANKNWKLVPSAFRDEKYIKNERLYLKEFQRQLPNETDNLDYFDILVKAQHYGVPTRLLDFTLNPLIALYFSCASHPESDGSVICLINQGLFSQSELTVQTMMHYIFRLKNKFYWDERYNNLLCKSLEKDSAVYHEVTSNIVIDILSKETPLFISPKLKNSRIQVQNGLFALFNSPLRKDYKNKNSSAFKILEEYDVSPEMNFRKIIIPQKKKEEILFQLDLIGINEAYLFPELQVGLDTIVKKIDQTNEKYKIFENGKSDRIE